MACRTKRRSTHTIFTNPYTHAQCCGSPSLAGAIVLSLLPSSWLRGSRARQSCRRSICRCRLTPVSFDQGGSSVAGLRAAHHELPAVDVVLTVGSRQDADRHDRRVSRRRIAAAPGPAGLAQRSCDPAHHRARHARRPESLDHAAARWFVPSDRPRSRSWRCSGRRDRVQRHRRGRRRRRSSRRTRSCSTRRCGAGRGSRSTIRCSKADTARRSTPSVAVRAFPAALRSTSSRCRRLARCRAIRPSDRLTATALARTCSPLPTARSPRPWTTRPIGHRSRFRPRVPAAITSRSTWAAGASRSTSTCSRAASS